MAKLRKVLDFNTKVLTVEAKVDLAEGVLFAILKEDGKNKAVLATNVITASTTPVELKAVGIVNKVSAQPFGVAYEANPVQQLDAGDFIDVIPHSLLIAEEVPNDAKVGDKAYLGTEGKLVFVKPTAVSATDSSNGVLLQEVGFVRNVERKIVEIIL